MMAPRRHRGNDDGRRGDHRGELGRSYAALCSVDNYCNGVVETPLTMETILEGAKRNRETMLTIVGKFIERSKA